MKLNVSAADNALNLELARSVAPYFRVSKKQAGEIIERSQTVVKQRPRIAGVLKVQAREQGRMAEAFRLSADRDAQPRRRATQAAAMGAAESSAVTTQRTARSASSQPPLQHHPLRPPP